MGWFEYRSKCSECGWDGPDTELKHFEMAFRRFPQCPACGARWNSKRKESYKVSALRGYAVHGPCGKWHRAGTECLTSNKDEANDSKEE